MVEKSMYTKSCWDGNCLSPLHIAGAWMLSSGCSMKESEGGVWDFCVAWADGSCGSQQEHSTPYPLHHGRDLLNSVVSASIATVYKCRTNHTHQVMLYMIMGFVGCT